MKQYSWDGFKNERLNRVYGISFEEIVAIINAELVLDIVENPNQLQYAGQKMFVIVMKEYVYLVPFRETNERVSLITAYPSRKATKKYLRKGSDEKPQA